MKKVIIGLLVVIVLIQFWPVDRSNPESDAALEIQAPAEIKAILENSCYDCHSNKTIWPWYSYVAPVSWLVADDVKEGREHMNFSEWESYDKKKQGRARDEIWDEVFEDHMPLPKYLRLHSDAALSEAQKQVIKAWALGQDVEADTVQTEKE